MPPKEGAPSVPPVSTSTTPAPISMASNTTITAGTPVQTYPSPAHAQWAAGQLAIDPSLQQSTTPQPATTVAATAAATAAKPQTHAVTAATAVPAASAAHLASYYHQNYSHYPYYQQYLAQVQAQAQAAQASTVAHSATHQVHTPTPVATPLRTATIPTATPTATATSTPVVAAQVPTVATVQTASAMPAAQAANALDTSDIATLNDALGSAGVDLRAEEESLQRHDSHANAYVQSHTSLYMQNRVYEDRSKKQPTKPAFDTRALGTTMRSVGAQHKVTKIPDESINYLALALRARLQDLVTAMIKAAKYRKQAQFDRQPSFFEALNNVNNAMDVDGVKLDTQTPMWSVVVRTDVAKQLSVLERIERDEEMKVRRERKERAEMAAAIAAGNVGGPAVDPSLLSGAAGGSSAMGSFEEDGQPKKKKKKEGPGVTARNMSEDVRKKMSNAVATQAAGLGKYAWMTAAASSPSPAPKPKAAATTASATTPSSSWARPYVPKKPTQAATPATTAETKAEGEDPSKVTVTMRDAMFVVEKERGHGGGRGSARGWT